MGPTASGVQIGARVFGIAGGGAHAEYIMVPAAQCAPVPDGLDLVTMGGAPEAFVTAHDALVTRAGLQTGEWVLVIRRFDPESARRRPSWPMLGARVVGTARTPAKLDLSLPRARSRARHRPSPLGRRRARRRRARVEHHRGDRRRRGRHHRSRGAKRGRGRDIAPPRCAGGASCWSARSRKRSPRLPVHITMAKRLSITVPCCERCAARREKAAALAAAFVQDVVPLLADGLHRAGRRRRHSTRSPPASSWRESGQDVRQGHPRLHLIVRKT